VPDAAARRWVRLALAPADREVLHERIAQRFGRMLESGFVEEVRRLYARGDLDLRAPSMRAVGYRQLWPHVAGDEPLDPAVTAAVTATRQLAKRQLTWLRAEQGLVWVDSEDRGRYTRALEQVLTAVSGATGRRVQVSER